MKIKLGMLLPVAVLAFLFGAAAVHANDDEGTPPDQNPASAVLDNQAMNQNASSDLNLTDGATDNWWGRGRGFGWGGFGYGGYRGFGYGFGYGYPYYGYGAYWPSYYRLWY